MVMARTLRISIANQEEGDVIDALQLFVERTKDFPFLEDNVRFEMKISLRALRKRRGQLLKQHARCSVSE